MQTCRAVYAVGGRDLPSNEIREIAPYSLLCRPIPLFGPAQSSPRLLDDLLAAALRPAYWSITLKCACEACRQPLRRLVLGRVSVDPPQFFAAGALRVD